MKDKELSRLYDEVSEITNEFRKLNLEIFREKPQRLSILRLVLNINQRRFGRIFNRSQGTVYMIENGFRKSVSEEIVSKILREIRGIQIPTKEDLIRRYTEISERGDFRGEYAKRMSLKASGRGALKSAILMKPTFQEQKIIEKLKMEGVKFDFHGVISTPRKFVVDFVIPSDKNPEILVEAKDLKSRFSKRLAAIDLAYRALKMRKQHPNAKFVAILEGKWQNSEVGIVKEEYDKVFLNAPLDRIVSEMKSS